MDSRGQVCLVQSLEDKLFLAILDCPQNHKWALANLGSKTQTRVLQASLDGRTLDHRQDNSKILNHLIQAREISGQGNRSQIMLIRNRHL